MLVYTLNKFLPFRADDNMQSEGLDIGECGIESYPEFKQSI